MKILGIIPSRFSSTRLPGKPLLEIGGKSMIQRVYEQCVKSRMLSSILVATDDKRIQEHVRLFGGNAVLTSPDHPSGTDRCYEAFRKESGYFDFVINVQGDEPFIAPDQIDALGSILSPEVEIATLVRKISNSDDLFNPSSAKVVLDDEKLVLYFSRSPIPYLREYDKDQWYNKHVYWKHIGIYAYRTDILEKISRMDPSSLERAESLEQLRWLEHGLTIKAAETERESFGVDTQEDLRKARNLYKDFSHS